MPNYFKKAMNWTFWSQLLLPVVLYIITIPLLKEVTTLSVAEIWLTALFIAVLKFINVRAEFNYRYANRGNAVLMDRFVRAIVSIIGIQMTLADGLIGIVFLVMMAYYTVTLKKKCRIIQYLTNISLSSSKTE